VDVTAAKPLEDLAVVQSEMGQYREELSRRPAIILLNKIDLLDAGGKELEEISRQVRDINPNVFSISALEKVGFDPVIEAMDELVTIERERENEKDGCEPQSRSTDETSCESDRH